MVVEPESFAWTTGRRVERRDGETWAAEFLQLPALEYAVTDGGKGLEKGLRLAAKQRPCLRHGLDVFHTLQEGKRALRRAYGRVGRAIDQADGKQKEVDRLHRRGKSVQGKAPHAAKRWRKAEELLDRTAEAEAAWKRVEQALELFTPEGKLQERCQAEGRVAEALPRLTDPEWAIVRTVQLHKSDPCWQEHAEEVRRALRRAWRASSLVEGINSVARMQQARHRRMTQGLLDLKRLYWNLRHFRVGRRRGKTPYEMLGLHLPEGGWWQLLKLTPAQLTQHLSAQGDTL